MSEAVRLGRIVPKVMKDIEKRMETQRKMNNAKNDSASRGLNEKAPGWQFSRQINVSTLIQLIFLASLIVGSWVNLQRQLDLLQRDVTMLLQSQQNFQQKIEVLSARSISYEYRLRALEKSMPEADSTFSQ